MITAEIDKNRKLMSSVVRKTKNNQPIVAKKYPDDDEDSQITINLAYWKYPIFEQVVTEYFDWTVSKNLNAPWDLLWSDVQIKELELYQKINHFPGMHNIYKKNYLSKNLNQMKKHFPDDFNFFPDTWQLPVEMNEFSNCFRKAKRKLIGGKEPNNHTNKDTVAKDRSSEDAYSNFVYIAKPNSSAQGKGIFLVTALSDIPLGQQLVIQQYITRPMTWEGYKFDLRIYVLVLGCDPLRILLYKDGLVRLATEKYEGVSESNKESMYHHLTNFSLNKENPNYQNGWFNNGGGSNLRTTESKFKKSILDFFVELKRRKGINTDVIWSNIKDICIKTMWTVQPILKHNYNILQKDDPYNQTCFELLGLDILLDSNMKPYLLEVNHSPSFGISSPVDFKVKSRLLIETFNLLNLSTEQRQKIISMKKKNFKKRTLTGKRSPLNTGELQQTWIDSRNFDLIYPPREDIPIVKTQFQKRVNRSERYNNKNATGNVIEENLPQCVTDENSDWKSTNEISQAINDKNRLISLKKFECTNSTNNRSELEGKSLSKNTKANVEKLENLYKKFIDRAEINYYESTGVRTSQYYKIERAILNSKIYQKKESLQTQQNQEFSRGSPSKSKKRIKTLSNVDWKDSDSDDDEISILKIPKKNSKSRTPKNLNNSINSKKSKDLNDSRKSKNRYWNGDLREEADLKQKVTSADTRLQNIIISHKTNNIESDDSGNTNNNKIIEREKKTKNTKIITTHKNKNDYQPGLSEDNNIVTNINDGEIKKNNNTVQNYKKYAPETECRGNFVANAHYMTKMKYLNKNGSRKMLSDNNLGQFWKSNMIEEISNKQISVTKQSFGTNIDITTKGIKTGSEDMVNNYTENYKKENLNQELMELTHDYRLSENIGKINAQDAIYSRFNENNENQGYIKDTFTEDQLDSNFVSQNTIYQGVKFSSYGSTKGDTQRGLFENRASTLIGTENVFNQNQRTDPGDKCMKKKPPIPKYIVRTSFKNLRKKLTKESSEEAREINSGDYRIRQPIGSKNLKEYHVANSNNQLAFDQNVVEIFRSPKKKDYTSFENIVSFVDQYTYQDKAAADDEDQCIQQEIDGAFSSKKQDVEFNNKRSSVVSKLKTTSSNQKIIENDLVISRKKNSFSFNEHSNVKSIKSKSRPRYLIHADSKQSHQNGLRGANKEQIDFTEKLERQLQMFRNNLEAANKEKHKSKHNKNKDSKEKIKISPNIGKNATKQNELNPSKIFGTPTSENDPCSRGNKMSELNNNFILIVNNENHASQQVVSQNSEKPLRKTSSKNFVSSIQNPTDRYYQQGKPLKIHHKDLKRILIKPSERSLESKESSIDKKEKVFSSTSNKRYTLKSNPHERNKLDENIDKAVKKLKTGILKKTRTPALYSSSKKKFSPGENSRSYMFASYKKKIGNLKKI